MQNNLSIIYGYCIIPKNTLLFRGHSDKSFDDCMFFGTKHYVAEAFNNEIQVWKTSTDILVLFLVEHLDERSQSTSALPRLFNSIFINESNSEFNDLDIKHWDISRRNKLVRKLFDEYKISGWLTSLENNIELEVCLFDKKANSNQLILVDNSNRKNKKYFKDSLSRMKIFPSEIFYIKSKEKLNQKISILSNGGDNFKRYKKVRNAWIKDEAKSEKDKVKLRHYYMDLRIKLKI